MLIHSLMTIMVLIQLNNLLVINYHMKHLLTHLKNKLRLIIHFILKQHPLLLSMIRHLAHFNRQ